LVRKVRKALEVVEVSKATVEPLALLDLREILERRENLE